ncbi:Dyp-type peroxidase [Streptomyces erythrochromogenes]|uniref:Dyp-type peroxidase n=1 Tax=Streptomyces erythrochromogenes TaxID=285574 RepID=UPI00386376F6|nr:Dyp-type peroxidase [Streptomyces erythrochromogenes]
MPGTDREPAAPQDGPGPVRRLTRRTLLGTGGLAALAAGGAATAAALRGGGEAAAAPAVPFHGPQQAGILTPRQHHVRLAAFDLGSRTDRGRAAALLLRWTTAAEHLTRGEPVPAGLEPPGSRAADTGALADTRPARLTLTFGLGPAFFDRTGLTAARPEALAPLPAFPEDQLDPARGGGDLLVQIGADDAFVTTQVLSTLRRLAHGEARLRWAMTGFTAADGRRNLMGQVDGTNNPDPARALVSAPDAPAWLAGGSYVVIRRIRMLLDHWDTLPQAHREQALGRRACDGAPLTGGGEHAPADLAAARPDGVPVIATNAHVRLAAPASNNGATMVRRSWSYHDGHRADGAPDAGLLFTAWQPDPRTGFVPVQQRLSRGDALSRYLVHEASAVFAVPGGIRPGAYVAQSLLEA